MRALGRTDGGAVLATLFDDAMISMTYARNLAEGHGLVWNPGEPAVEGYSNTLWTLFMALTHLLPLPDRLAALPVVAAAAGLLVAVVVLVHRLSLELAPERPRVAVAAAWATALLYPLSYWTLRGMEVGLIAALTAAAALLALRLERAWRRRTAVWLAAVLAAVVLVRDDTALVAVIVLAALAWRTRDRVPARAIAAVAVPAVAVVVGHELVRLAVYDELLPNTYYLKVSGIPLSTRLGRGLWAGVRVEVLPALAAVVLGAYGAWRRTSRAWVLVALAASGFAYSVVVGGDAWEFMPYPNRYITSVLPVVLPVALIGAADLARRFSVRPVVFAVAVVAALAAPWSVWAVRNAYHANHDAFWARQGIAVRDNTPPGTTVAVHVAGNGPYFAHRPVIDMLGKSDPVIAGLPPVDGRRPGHNKRDLRYSIGELRPDLVLVLWNPTDEERRYVTSLGYERIGEIYYLPDRLTPAQVRPIATVRPGLDPS